MRFGAKTIGAALVCLGLGFGVAEAQPKSLPQEIKTQGTGLSAAKRAEAKKLLAKLIQTTPPNSPDLPDYLYRYGDLCYEEARSARAQFFLLEDQIAEANQKGDTDSVKKLTAEKTKQEKIASEGRLDAFKSYKRVVDDHPTYAKRDEVLFHMAFNLQELSQEFLALDPAKAESYMGYALSYYKVILKEYPSSVYVPNSLLVVGQDFFDDGDLASAQKVFDKIVVSYPESEMYGYALYMIGWCEYNNLNYKESISKWVATIDFSRKNPKLVSLEKEATRDIPKAYAQFGDAAKAKGFFQKIAGPDSYPKMLQRLAEIYQEQGQFSEAIVAYRDLISLNPKSDDNYLYQHQIASATLSLSVAGAKRSDVVVELQKLTKTYQEMQSRGADAKKIEDAKALTSTFLFGLATGWHAECFKTKAPNCYDSVKPLYEQYLANFPDAADRYETTWNYAEMLADMASSKSSLFEEVAFAYLAVIKAEPNGKHTKDAILSAVDSLKKSADISKDVRSSVAFSETEKKKVEIFELSIKLDPSGPASSYSLASLGYLYWLHQMNKEAVPYFKKLVDERPNEPISGEANRYLLISLSDLGDEKELARYAEKTASFDPETTAAVLPLSFKNCQQQFDNKQDTAGDCFYALPNKFPAMSEASKIASLYNAALAYESVKQMGSSVSVREELIASYPKSAEAKKSLFTLGSIYAGLGSYTKAAETLEQFATKYPDTEEAALALNDAAIYREGLGDYEKAKENNKKYLATATRKGENPASIAEAAFRAAKLVERAGDAKKTQAAYEEYIKTHGEKGSLDNLMVAKTWIASNSFKSNKKEDAYTRCQEVVSIADKVDLQKLNSGLDAAAECQFYLAEKGFAAFEASKLPSSLDVEKLVAWIGDANKTRKDLGAMYLKATSYQSKYWTLASLARIGEMSHGLAQKLESAPTPAIWGGVKVSSLSKEEQEKLQNLFKDTIITIVEPLYQDATTSFGVCIDGSTQSSYFNEWSSKCESYLNKMDPVKYSLTSEWQVEPTREVETITPALMITKLK
jgi:tetratricopeptide (TPR) repeat protein